MTDPRTHLPPISGSIHTAIGVVRFQFVATGTAVPAAVLTNHGTEPAFKIDDREVRIKFLMAPSGPQGIWQRTDAAEPHCDFVDGRDTVDPSYRTQVHDALLDAWEAYMAQRPELVGYARLTEVNNDIVQCDEKIARLEDQLTAARGKRKNLIDLEARIRATLPQTAPPITTEQREILAEMAGKNCWLSMRDGEEAELHPFQSPDVLATVSGDAARSLVVGGYIQLHRHLADGRQTFKMADRGREAISK